MIYNHLFNNIFIKNKIKWFNFAKALRGIFYIRQPSDTHHGGKTMRARTPK